MKANPSTQCAEGAVHYAARQPILTANQKVIGYKLFFRQDGKQGPDQDSPQAQISALIDLSSLVGLNTLCDQRLAFISCSRQALLDKHITLLPAERAVAEIPRNIDPSPEVVDACLHLKQAGYRIALENVTLGDPREPLFGLCDFFKVNVHHVASPHLQAIAALHRGRRSRLVADKVESWDDFQSARAAGFQYFQGYFFRKPEILHTHPVASNRIIGMQLLQTITKAELDWQEIENVIRRDAALYYRLLRYLNSAAFGLRHEIRSVRQALTILGENEFRRWCRLAILLDVAQNRPSDLVLSALIRAQFAELVGKQLRMSDTDLFLLGILSLMDAVLEMPMGLVLDGLHLNPNINTALLEHQGPLAPIYDLILAVEAGAWGATVRLCEHLRLDEEFVAQASLEAMAWAQSINKNA